MNDEPDVIPVLHTPEELGEPPTLLHCGKCGYAREVKHYVYVQKPWIVEAVCDCPLAAVFKA